MRPFSSRACRLLLAIGLVRADVPPCTPNAELTVCRNELRAIADALDYATLVHPEWRDLFHVDDAPVSATLHTLADRLEAKLTECPCVGPCTQLEQCGASR